MSTHAPGTVYKLHQGDNPLGMMGAVLDRPAIISTNRGRMSAKGWITKQSPDRMDDIVVAAGGLVGDHRKLPSVHLNHNRLVPCGRAEDRLGAYTVKHAGDGWQGETYFSQTTEIGEQTFRLVDDKVICGMSIGFLPVNGTMQKSAGGGIVYKQWRLIEYSHVVLPEHPDCLVEAVYKGLGGKPLCHELDNYLRPLCPERREMVTGGWETDKMAEAFRAGLATAGEVRKAGTYKTAEPKETAAQLRPAVFYTCPHCGKEFTHEHVFKDEADGVMRHGDCRGAVVLKPPEPTTGLEQPAGAGRSMQYLSLAACITKRLTALREKAMPPPPRRAAPPDDEFAPVDAPPAAGADADPNADPNLAAAQDVDPHADHKAVVDDAVGNVLASIYDKFTSGQIDMPAAVKLFKECLGHHGKVASLGGGDGADDYADPDADPDADEDDDLSPDEDTDADAGGEGPPDLEDRKKKKAEKALAEVWNKEFAPALGTVYHGLGHIADEPDLCPQKAQAYARKLRRKMLAATPTVEKAIEGGLLVVKALDAPPAAAGPVVMEDDLAAALLALNGRAH